MAISTAVSPSAVARVTGIKTTYKSNRGGRAVILPQRVAVIGQGASASTYSNTKAQYTSAAAVGAAYGYGSPLHLVARQLLPENGDGVGDIPVTFYPLDDDGSGVAATGDITPSGSQTVAASYIVRVNNIDSEEFVISPGDTVAEVVTAMTAAINAVLEMPVIASDDATEVGIAAKWAGVSSNSIVLEVIGSATAGTSFAVTQPSGGLVDPDIQSALDQFGDVWETLVLNCMTTANTAALNALQTHGSGRWGALTRKPYVAFVGTTEADVATAITVPEARKTEFINSQLPLPGSSDLPCVVAARMLAKIALLANANPAHDYGSQAATGLTPGADSVQWDYLQRDQAVKGGSSTVEIRDGVPHIADVVTFYHPTGNPLPEYRRVVTIVKLMNFIFNIDLKFASEEWDGAPLLPDGQPTENPTAKTPAMAIADAGLIVDGLAAEAIASDPETIKDGIIAEIDDQNPDRLNLCIPAKVSGNTNIKSIDLKWSFYFGG